MRRYLVALLIGAASFAGMPGRAHGGTDVAMGDLSGLSIITNSGGLNAVSCETTACNVGTTTVPWIAAMNPNHPFIAYSVFRLKDGRFEQIGRAWAKHTYVVSAGTLCGACTSAGAQALGIGCSDTYYDSHNASQFFLGPREEIDPYTAAWQPCGSWFDGTPVDCQRSNNGSGLGPFDHRCVLANSDLGLPGASYFYEGMYIVAGDVDTSNNIASRRFTMFATGDSWIFQTPLDDNPVLPGPVMTTRYLTGGPNELLSTIADPGLLYVASKASDLGGGMWHYEYAVYNYTYSRRIRRFAVPIPATALVSNVGFHDSDMDPGNDWPGTFDISCGAVSWQTDTFAANPQANALIWGALFNFRFDANVPPTTGTASMAAFLTGGGADAPATNAIVPDIGCIKGDVNGDGLIDGQDVQAFAAVMLNPPCIEARGFCAADVDNNSTINSADATGLAQLMLTP